MLVLPLYSEVCCDLLVLGQSMRGHIIKENCPSCCIYQLPITAEIVFGVCDQIASLCRNLTGFIMHRYGVHTWVSLIITLSFCRVQSNFQHHERLLVGMKVLGQSQHDFAMFYNSSIWWL